jgi:aspartate/methionine/tyrosine aminotransferase
LQAGKLIDANIGPALLNQLTLTHLPNPGAAPVSKLKGSRKATQFTESVIREMTRLNHLYGGVNLSQGFPDFPAPEAVKEAACAAIRADVNQYAVTWGTRGLREAIAADFVRRYGVSVSADEQVTVCCGATEAMMATMMAIIDPGDEVVIFEPFYENYGPDAILSGATPRYVTLREPSSDGADRSWTFDPDDLAAAFNGKTKAIILNTPNNPTGKVFTRGELETIAALCRKWDAIAISDEIYEHLVYDGHPHVPIATIEGMADRTVTINGLSKTYSVTGWRVGWTISPPALTGAIRKVHDFLTVGAAAPLQEAGIVALGLPDSYHAELAAAYRRRRDVLLEILERRHFTCYKPYGAYYVMTDISAFGFPNDVEFARYLVKDIGVAAVPGSSFYRDASLGRTKLRFCFCKRDETLAEADRRMGKLLPAGVRVH